MRGRFFFITTPHRQSRSVFGGFISISGGGMLLCKEARSSLIMAEDSPYVTMQRIATF